MEMEKDSFLEKLKISKESINDDLKKAPTYLYQFGLKELKLQAEFDRLELKLDTKMSQTASQIRAKYKSAKGALSETHVKDLVNIDPEVIELKEKLLETKHYLKLAKLKSKALEDKGENLINYSHNVREELRSTNSSKFTLKKGE
jgi:hypothetical protein